MFDPFGGTRPGRGWQDVPFNAADFTASAGTVTFPSGTAGTELQSFEFAVGEDGVYLVNLVLIGVSVSTTPNQLFVKVPGGRTAARKGGGYYILYDNSVSLAQGGVWALGVGQSLISFQKLNTASNMTAATGTSGIWFNAALHLV